MNNKHSCVFYYEWRSSLAKLPQNERGDVMLLLMEYSERLAAGEAIDVDTLLAQNPQFSQGAVMAFSIYSEIIRRDTIAWLKKQQRYQGAAQQRWQQNKPEGSRAAEEKPCKQRTNMTQERDYSQMRKYLPSREELA